MRLRDFQVTTVVSGGAVTGARPSWRRTFSETLVLFSNCNRPHAMHSSRQNIFFSLLTIQQESCPMSLANNTASKALRTIDLIEGNVLTGRKSSILIVELDVSGCVIGQLQCPSHNFRSMSNLHIKSAFAKASVGAKKVARWHSRNPLNVLDIKVRTR